METVLPLRSSQPQLLSHDLPGGVVAVVQGHTGQGLGLPVAADVAHGRCHAGAESRECESEQSATKISKD